MNKIAVALLLCLVPTCWSRATEAPAAEPTPMAKAVAAIKLELNWERIEIREDDPRSYHLTLHYKPKALVTNMAMVEADTKQIARAVLAELVRQGRKPAEESISVYVSAQQGVRGETSLVKVFGDTFYKHSGDQLEFEPRKPSWRCFFSPVC